MARRKRCRDGLIGILALLAGPAFAQSPAQQCEDAGAVDGVSLKFCTWQQEGVWHFEAKVISQASAAKAVSVACRPSDAGMAQVIEDAYEPGAEKTVVTGTLPASAGRPASHCQIDNVEDWVPSDSHVEEE